MRRFCSLFIAAQLFALAGHGKAEIVESIICYDQGTPPGDREDEGWKVEFKIHLLAGNQGAKLYAGNVYGVERYLMTNHSRKDGRISETYTLIRSTYTNPPKHFSLSYPQKYREQSNTFELRMNKRGQEKILVCEVP